VQHQRGRGRVQQLRVVDADHQPLRARKFSQRLHAELHQLEQIVEARSARDHPRERAQRHARRAPRRLNPRRRCTLALGLRQRLTRQPRLPHTSWSKHHHPVRRSQTRARDQLQIPIATYQRPTQARSQKQQLPPH
jgi:hypothetical protein